MDLFTAGLSVSVLSVVIWAGVYPRRAIIGFENRVDTCVILALGLGPTVAGCVLPQRTSIVLGGLVAMMAAYAVVTLRSHDKLGGASNAQRMAWTLWGALLTWSLIVDSVTPPGPSNGRLVTCASTFALWLAVGLLAGRSRLTVRSVFSVSCPILILNTVPAIFRSDSWRPCTDGSLEKCSVAGKLFIGLYQSENAVGIIGSLRFLSAIAAFRGWERVFLASFGLLVLLATGWRAAFITLAALVAFGAMFAATHRRAGALSRVGLSVLAIPACVGLSYYLRLTATPYTLSNRERIWMSATRAISDRETTGEGVSKWEWLQQVDLAPQHYLNSGYVLLAFSGGLVAVVLWSLLIGCLYLGASELPDAVLARTLVLLIVIYSLTEVIWNPLAVDFLTWLPVILVASASTTKRLHPQTTRSSRKGVTDARSGVADRRPSGEPLDLVRNA